MTTQLLFYERTVPVSQERHGDWSIRTGTDYRFARHVNSVPLLATEFQSAAAEYTIVFTGTDEAVMPALILGVREEENLFVSNTGSWLAKYVPAFVRRYPFVFSINDEGRTFTLCIDEEFAGWNQEGRGERLFDSDGERTLYLKGVLGFLQAFQVQHRSTQAFCNKLRELNLLEQMAAQFTSNTGQGMSLTGFMAVNRESLKGISGEQLSEMAKADELELVYTHLQSMRNFSLTFDRAAGTEAAAADTAPATSNEVELAIKEEKPATTKGVEPASKEEKPARKRKSKSSEA